MILRGRTLWDRSLPLYFFWLSFLAPAFGCVFAGLQVGANPAAGAAGAAAAGAAGAAAAAGAQVAAAAAKPARAAGKGKAASSAGVAPGTPAAAPAGPSAGATPEPKQASAEKGQAQVGADAAQGDQMTSAKKGKKGAGGAGTMNKTETRGRKPKDLPGHMVKLATEFKEAPPDAPLYWAAEAKTGMKLFEKLNKDAQDRIKKSSDQEESTRLRCILKHTTAIYNVLNITNIHGLDSQEFADEFDMQATSCQLDPVVTVDWPPHVRWSRHRMRIGAMALPDPWFQMISSDSLQENGVSDLRLEQDKLLGERVMSLLKQSSYKDRGLRVNELIDRAAPPNLPGGLGGGGGRMEEGRR